MIKCNDFPEFYRVLRTDVLSACNQGVKKYALRHLNRKFLAKKRTPDVFFFSFERKLSHEQIQLYHSPVISHVPMIQRDSLFQAKYHDQVGMIFQSRYRYPILQHLLDE